MNNELFVLTITALSIGFFHTLFGPDHYVPFVVLSKARNWSTGKTAWITCLCGVGHVGSSVLLGLVGIALGIAVSQLQFIESFRGNIAAWLLIAFGLVYMAWGLRKAYRNKPHTVENQAHLTPWILFTIFVFGPCEPLIPILMYPASYQSPGSLLWIVFVFSTVTIGTMLTVVLLMRYGIQLIPMTTLQRFTHALAGAAILLCGIAIRLLE